MKVDRQRGIITHHCFKDLPDLLAAGDLLVLNNTRVVPARLLGKRAKTGGRWEGLYLGQVADGRWELLCQTRGKLAAGEIIEVDPGPLTLALLEKTDVGHWLALPAAAGLQASNAFALLEKHGHVPLPPYIRKGRAGPVDRERYQTVFARKPGAVAAPTAGLHFTPELLSALAERGIGKAFVTLHVGLGTFSAIESCDVGQHVMHAEWGDLPVSTVEALKACKQRQNRIVAVGTTCVRVLETSMSAGAFCQWTGQTRLYIYPPYHFQAVDALITNFHLPRTSLLVLVSAFAGSELVLEAYKKAIEESYRFFSYGDAMLIV
jgi:S-adenosylmethionine:tRNA ribosyltransferase-isomerase